MVDTTGKANKSSLNEAFSVEAKTSSLESDQSPSFFNRAATSLARSLKEAVSFVKNHPLAFASLIVTTIFAGPLAGAIAFMAALFLESAWSALRQNDPNQGLYDACKLSAGNEKASLQAN